MGTKEFTLPRNTGPLRDLKYGYAYIDIVLHIHLYIYIYECVCVCFCSLEASYFVETVGNWMMRCTSPVTDFFHGNQFLKKTTLGVYDELFKH